jgi:hypothetical protein
VLCPPLFSQLLSSPQPGGIPRNGFNGVGPPMKGARPKGILTIAHPSCPYLPWQPPTIPHPVVRHRRPPRICAQCGGGRHAYGQRTLIGSFFVSFDWINEPRAPPLDFAARYTTSSGSQGEDRATVPCLQQHASQDGGTRTYMAESDFL